MTKKYAFITYFTLLIGFPLFAQQEFSLLEQFNGRYDFSFIGNTMNYAENGTGAPCIIQTSSSAELNFPEDYQIEKVYLYWSGSGTGDFNIKLNDIDIVPGRDYPLHYVASGRNLDFFVAVTDVTEQILNTGNGTYTVSELDVSENFIPPAQSPYCQVATNYAGWALVIVYKDESLPLNQLNVYEGLKNVPTELSITLNNLNVIDNIGAKIGFVAWEGDSSISNNETLRINGNIMSNPPLNPATNAFNGTNSITGATNLYNMDLDIYDIQDNIQIGDTTAEISLTSGQDFVMISTVVTKLNSQLPDATIVSNEIHTYCNAPEIEIEYTVFNLNATDTLPANTPIAFYINGILAGTAHTYNDIPIGGSEDGVIVVVLPEEITQDIEILLVVDDIGNGTGIVTETDENNNTHLVLFQLMVSPEFTIPENLIVCNRGNTTGIFNFSDYEYIIKQNPNDVVTFHNSYEDAQNGLNPIFNISSYQTNEIPKEIFVRIEDEDNCYSITSFFLHLRNCPPTIFNGISDNNDGLNDDFNIEGLYDIFENFELLVYSRWGQLLWRGDNSTPKWDGKVTEKSTIGDNNVPEGTYFYILYLNDKDYPKPITGYLYLTR